MTDHEITIRLWEKFYYKVKDMSEDEQADWIYNKLDEDAAHAIQVIFSHSPNPYMTKVLLISGIYADLSESNKTLMRMTFPTIFEDYEKYWQDDYLTEYNRRGKSNRQRY